MNALSHATPTNIHAIARSQRIQSTIVERVKPTTIEQSNKSYRRSSRSSGAEDNWYVITISNGIHIQPRLEDTFLKTTLRKSTQTTSSTTSAHTFTEKGTAPTSPHTSKRNVMLQRDGDMGELV